MGSSISQEIIFEDLKRTLGEMRSRISRLETDYAEISKTVTNVKVSQNETGLTVSRINEHIFKAKLLEEGRSYSVRRAKGTHSMFVK